MQEKMQVYLDNNATCMVSPGVKDAMMPFFGELYGNPSSMHIWRTSCQTSCNCKRKSCGNVQC